MNDKVVKRANRIVAFWDGESRGTYHTINLAARNKKPLIIFLPECWS